jgi:hypothetical protein
MQLTLDIPEKIERKAAELGVEVSVLIEQAFDFIAPDPPPPGFTRLGLPRWTREEATAVIKEIQRTHTLGGEVTIKQLIEEGRRC